MKRKFSKERIKEFLDKFCTRTYAREDPATTELMMDDHTCIKYERKMYYVPEENSLFEPEDEAIVDYLNDQYAL